MRAIQSRDREDSNITPLSVPQRNVLSPSTQSVFWSGIAYSCPKPSVFLSKGNNVPEELGKHVKASLFHQENGVLCNFFFLESGCLKKMPTFFGRL